jgi:hypothetical protein
MRTTSHSTTAPDISRIVVKVAASILVCVSAIRQSRELPAKAIMASAVRAITRITGVCIMKNGREREIKVASEGPPLRPLAISTLLS